MTPIRILHVLSGLRRGGAELRTLDLMRHVDRDRYRFHFCALSGSPGELADEARGLGAEIFPLALDVRFPWRFRGLLSEGRFDVVHSHVHYFSGFIVRLARQARVPVRIAHFRNTHDGNGDGWRDRLQRAVLRRWIDRHATHILAVCEGAMQTAWDEQWRDDPRCRVIYNGLDPAPYRPQADDLRVRRELGLPGSGPLYLHLGRLVEQKNHRRLVAIFAALAREQPEARLLLVGRATPDRERGLREQIAGLGLDGRVVLAGERTDVPRLLAVADLLLFPSLWEGLPGAVLEACAAGTPVLASDLPGVREIAVHFPTVHRLALEASDLVWAGAAQRLSREHAGGQGSAAEAFSRSVFHIDRCAEAHARVWSAARPAPAARIDGGPVPAHA